MYESTNNNYKSLFLVDLIYINIQMCSMCAYVQFTGIRLYLIGAKNHIKTIHQNDCDLVLCLKENFVDFQLNRLK